jgi:hypothetical protein
MYQRKLNRISCKTYKEQREYLKKNPPPKGFVVMYSKSFNKFILKASSQDAKEQTLLHNEKPPENQSKPKIGFGNTSKYRNRLSLNSSTMARWVSEHLWSHWCTFTFKEETSAIGARNQLQRMYSRFNHNGLKCLYFVVEEGTRYDRIHAHAVGLFYHQSDELVFNFWSKKIGRCQVRSFEKEGGAVEYITNYLNKGTVDWDILGSPRSCRLI